MKPRINEQYLTTGDVAKAAKVSNQAIDTAVKNGRLTVALRTAGGIRLFRQQDVEKFCEARLQHRVSSSIDNASATNHAGTDND
jgi:hypothetical protein